ncbi:MAG TPA: hypothetical protein VHG08_04230 [Longimicrobium sp.]|nr:hypothetical protein [Longimicrobium sp.]
MGLFDRLRGRSAEPPPSDAYTALRTRALGVQPADLGPTADPAAPIHGVIMESGHPNGVATFVCMGDGTVSLYTSTGGGVIGAGEHESVRGACLQMLAFTNRYAEDFIRASMPSPTHPLPRNGEVFFYLLTGSGVYRAQGDAADLARRRHPFSNLFENCNVVMSLVRRIDERGRSGS